MMAASTAPVIPALVLSQKQRRAALRKERRKRKRQALAQAREYDLKIGAPLEEGEEINDGDDDNDFTDEKSLRLHEEWLERERRAQEEFRLQVEREEATRRRKEEEEQMIKAEWEAQQRREQEEKDQRQQEKRVREEAVQKMLDEAENQLDKEGPWMNPEAPVTVNSEKYGTERDVANCPFFLKTGACRFGDRCSRKHVYPTSSPTLMVRGMFTTFGMEQSYRDDYDIDACLEHSEEELQESFVDFYHDVLPEFKNVGKVVQFKVSCNYEPHLKGNVYIQFDTEEHCKEAFIKFNGRWYAGRQLHCEICPVTRWKNAICGLFDRQKCTKGKHCNFLHVFRNPGNEFWEADRDLHLSPNRSIRSSRRDGWHSERYGERSWRQRRYSRSPERWESRRGGDRRRSRSRERRSSHQHAEDRRSSRSERSDRRKDWGRDRSRSRSTDRDRSRDKDRESRNRSEERSSRFRDEDPRRDAKDKSRSKSRERERLLSKEKSPKKPGSSKTPSNDTDTRRRHKHSKKSKKKHKKKHKKKSHVAREGTASSGESEKASEDDTSDIHSLPSPSKEENKTEQKQGDPDQRVGNEEKIISEEKCEQSDPELTGNGEGGCS